MADSREKCDPEAARGVEKGRGPSHYRGHMTMPDNIAERLTVSVNGEERAVPAPMTVADLLTWLGLEPKKIAVERNLEIVPKSLYGETALADGDRIEIVQFVGGG